MLGWGEGEGRSCLRSVGAGEDLACSPVSSFKGSKYERPEPHSLLGDALDDGWGTHSLTIAFYRGGRGPRECHMGGWGMVRTFDFFPLGLGLGKGSLKSEKFCFLFFLNVCLFL